MSYVDRYCYFMISVLRCRGGYDCFWRYDLGKNFVLGKLKLRPKTSTTTLEIRPKKTRAAFGGAKQVQKIASYNHNRVTTAIELQLKQG